MLAVPSLNPSRLRGVRCALVVDEARPDILDLSEDAAVITKDVELGDLVAGVFHRESHGTGLRFGAAEFTIVIRAGDGDRRVLALARVAAVLFRAGGE